ncbi:hypothetical protein CQW23_25686 [Capsicum baccatum]|uniref:Disease resistance protein winged helix domain-containing protein n=1 Tax=Capsicum baccatum TaxID=33114 RepID=A0A2G2VLN1_CAPBA|nr:hypothetical protein CQW23_25686 [Capsicum baccatum]
MYADSNSPHHMTLLNLDNSWKLLCDKVFGPEHDHPPELEEIGKRIAEKCQGLPLTISVIGGYLSKMTRTLESWKYVAQTLSEIIASHPDKCLGLLGLSYHHLPNHLKPCFLSMSSFPEDFQFETCILIQLWIAEDFISAFGSSKSLEEVAEDYLEDFISRNLIMLEKTRSIEVFQQWYVSTLLLAATLHEEIERYHRAAEDSAKKIEQEQDMGNNFLKVYIRSSGSKFYISPENSSILHNIN